jgi:hypothetical protein
MYPHEIFPPTIHSSSVCLFLLVIYKPKRQYHQKYLTLMSGTQINTLMYALDGKFWVASKEAPVFMCRTAQI